MTIIADMNEDELVDRLVGMLPSRPDLLVGAGDDCAIVQKDSDSDTLLKTDCVVEDIHFTRQTKPELIGRKALARAISDIAAMGGTPEHALITLMCDSSRPWQHIASIYTGISTLAKEFNISVAGGETSRLPHHGLIINVALTGTVPHEQAILRSTAQVGDLIAVTGQLGNTLDTEHHLRFIPRVREATILRKHGVATSMMDLSDGLAADLPRLCGASHVSYVLDLSALPCRQGCSTEHALCDGEDYELLFTLSHDNAIKLKDLPINTAISIIGHITPYDTQNSPNLHGGWQHF